MQTITTLNICGQPCHLWQTTNAEGHFRYTVTRDRGRPGQEIRAEPTHCAYQTRRAAINAARDDIAIEIEC